MNAKPPPSSDMEDGVLLEFITIGNAVKVSAIDTMSGMEVSIMGPLNASRESLSAVAVQKLKARLAQKKAK